MNQVWNPGDVARYGFISICGLVAIACGLALLMRELNDYGLFYCLTILYHAIRKKINTDMPSFKSFFCLFITAVLVCAPLWGLAHIAFFCDSAFCNEMLHRDGYIIAFLWITVSAAFILTCLGSCCSCGICSLLQLSEMFERRQRPSAAVTKTK